MNTTADEFPELADNLVQALTPHRERVVAILRQFKAFSYPHQFSRLEFQVEEQSLLGHD